MEWRMSDETYRGLEGKTVLVTRPKAQSEALVKALEAEGANVVLFPTIEIGPPDSWTKCDEAIRRIPAYDVLVFTSANAVERFFERILIVDGRNLSAMRQKNVYAVGEMTKNALESRGCRVNDIPEKATATDLGLLLQKLDLRQKKVLFPRGDLGGSALLTLLRSSGAHVDDPIVYKTGKPEATSVMPIKEMLLKREIDAVTFFSPSSVRNFVELFSAESLIGIPVFVIGEVTAQAALGLGVGVAVISPTSTVRSMIESLKEYFSFNRPKDIQ